MALTLCTIATDPTKPIFFPDGLLAANVPVVFKLVTAGGGSIIVTDLIDGTEVVDKLITIQTNASGHLSVSLWPTERADVPCYWSVQIKNVSFKAPLPDSGTITWGDFVANRKVGENFDVIVSANAADITAGILDGNRLPGMSALKKGGVPPTGTPAGKVLADNGTWVVPSTSPTLQATGDLINTATSKTPPVDADMLPLVDSAAANILKKLSWANIKATLKAYFDTLYTGDQILPTDATIVTTDIVTNDASLTKHGWFPQLPVASGKYLKDDLTWESPTWGGTGDVVGPASAVANNVVLFDTTSGKLLKDSGLTIPVKATGAEIITGTDDAKFATAKAIKDAALDRVSPHFFQPKSSLYYSFPPIVGVPSTTVYITANQMAVIPFVVGNAATVAAIGVEVTSEGAGSIRMGIYPSATNYLDAVATLILDAGTVSVGTTGFKYITGLSTLLPAGIYQLVLVSNISLSVKAYTTAQAICLAGVDATGYNNLNNMGLGRICNFTYAALPSTPPTATGNYTASAPCIVLRLT
jgi:hypothetical protein